MSLSDKMHIATSYDVHTHTQAWFDYSRSSIFPQSERKEGKVVEHFNVSTYQCSIFFNNLGSFNRKSEFRKPENLNKPITKGENLMSLIYRYSRNFGDTTVLKFSDGRGGQVVDRHKAAALNEYGMVGCHSARDNGLSVRARMDSTGYVRLL